MAERHAIDPVRVVIGAVISAQIPPLMIILLMIAAAGIGIHLLMAPLIYVATVIISAPAYVVFGIPTYLILRSLRWDTWWLMASLGFLFGILSWESLSLLAGRDSLSGLTANEFLRTRDMGLDAFFGVTGALAGVAFWYAVYVRLAPQRTRR